LTLPIFGRTLTPDLNELRRDKTQSETASNQNAEAFSQRLLESVQVSRRKKLVRQNCP
jgi:hypothetical protein